MRSRLLAGIVVAGSSDTASKQGRIFFAVLIAPMKWANQKSGIAPDLTGFHSAAVPDKFDDPAQHDGSVIAERQYGRSRSSGFEVIRDRPRPEP